MMQPDIEQAQRYTCREHVYRDAATGTRAIFYAIHAPNGTDTGAHGETAADAWQALLKRIADDDQRE